MNILINSTVLSNFAVVDRLGLLSNLYSTLQVAHAVYEEIERKVEEGYTFLAKIEAHIYPFHPSSWLHLAGDKLSISSHPPIIPLFERGYAKDPLFLIPLNLGEDMLVNLFIIYDYP